MHLSCMGLEERCQNDNVILVLSKFEILKITTMRDNAIDMKNMKLNLKTLMIPASNKAIFEISETICFQKQEQAVAEILMKSNQFSTLSCL